jgi:hypothetical protein
MRWAGHVTALGSQGNEYKVLVIKLEGKGCLDDLKERDCLDYLKERDSLDNLKERECLDYLKERGVRMT